MRPVSCAVLLSCLSLTGMAQLTIVSREQLPLDDTRTWGVSMFSPDGKKLYFTTIDYNEIHEYSFESRRQTLLTNDRGSGFGFSLSPDGSRMAWRRTTYNASSGIRLQEIVSCDLATRALSFLGAGPDLGTPVFAGAECTFTVDGALQSSLPSTLPLTVLGIENTKIALLRAGQKEIMDPLGGGSYIWPELSPGGTHLVAYDMSRGTFVTNMRGEVVRLGRVDAPRWTHDGRWIIGMIIREDGHHIESADIVYRSADGLISGSLTSTNDTIEMYPSCSPVDNRIAYATASGGIMVVTYEVKK